MGVITNAFKDMAIAGLDGGRCGGASLGGY
jgi:hypothetical protein